MFAQHKYPKEILPRKYTIDELLKMRRTLPYVSCPLSRFQRSAWEENILCASKLPGIPDSVIERRGPRRYVPEPEIPSAETVERVQSFLNYNSAPTSAHPQSGLSPRRLGSSNQSSGFGKNIPQRINPPIIHSGSVYGAVPIMTSPLSPTNTSRYNGGMFEKHHDRLMSPPRSSRKPYGNSRMTPNQDTVLSLEDLAKMGIQILPPSAMIPQGAYPGPEYSGGYGSLVPPIATNTRSHASQGFVPGGTLKTVPTTGITPLNEGSGIQWDTPSAPTPLSPLQEAFNQRTNQPPARSAFYAGVGVPDKENSNLSTTYRGITATTDSMKNMSLKNAGVPPPGLAPPPGLTLLGDRATQQQQLEFLNYMTKRASAPYRYAS